MNGTIRIRFSKLGKIRFTSHRDVARIWERALRRASIPVAYTQGFSPHPKLSFGLALSTSHESLGEYLDVDVAEPVDVDSIPARADPCLPVGLDVQAAEDVEPGTPSLQQAVEACSWRIEVSGVSDAELREQAAAVLAAPALVVTRTRKGRQVTEDIRPAIESLAIEGDGVLLADLATQPRGLRPSELIAVIGDGLTERRVCRLHQWISIDGARREPIPCAEARAS